MNRYSRNSDSRKKSKWAFTRVLCIVVPLVVAGIFLTRFGRESSNAEPLPRKSELAKLKPRDLQQQTTEYGIQGGAIAGKQALAAESKPKPGSKSFDAEPEVVETNSGWVVKQVRSPTPFVLPRDKAEAESEAMKIATGLLAERLGAATPTKLKILSSTEVLGTEAEKKQWEANGLERERGWVVLEVEAEHTSIRAEAARGRVVDVGFWFGAVFLVLLTGYGFLTLDAFTKGYLTWILAGSAAVLAISAIAALAALVL